MQYRLKETCNNRLVEIRKIELLEYKESNYGNQTGQHQGHGGY